MSQNKQVHIISGGTISKVRPHFALSAPAYGSVGRTLRSLANVYFPAMDTHLHLTRMAGGPTNLETVEDVARLVAELQDNPATKVVILAAAIADFTGDVVAPCGRLETSRGEHLMRLTPNEKVVDCIRNTPNAFGQVRKDIFLVSFKATAGAVGQAQYLAGLHNLKRSSSNLVFANDVVNNRCMVITPEEARYHETTSRREALRGLMEIAALRSHLTFTRSTVVGGGPVAWDDALVPATLREVVDHCIARGSYKPFHGVTAGHFAAQLSATEFLTSRRKTNFNQLNETGLVKVRTDGPDTVIAYGSKPSVGGQSQRIIFREHQGMDCIVHFHCPIKEGSLVPRVSQRAFECGSHECGKNTSQGLRSFGDIKAVYLEEHGPNIVFSRNTEPKAVIELIEQNFDLTKKTGGYQITTNS